tara:strand:- start:338 stop:943 length:606 start_codon:yes stop_codon:yes gene_type:complete
MRLYEIIKEEVGIGGIGASMIAVAPVGVGGMQKRNPDGTAKNALDQDNLLGGTKKKKKKKKLSEDGDQALKSVQKTIPKLQRAAGAGQTDKVMQYMGSAVKQLAAMNVGDKLLNMFDMWARTIKKGIDDGVYSPEQLPQMQKAYDSIMAKMPELKQMNIDAKKYMSKNDLLPQDPKLDTKGNYKGTNIKPTAQQLNRMDQQ